MSYDDGLGFGLLGCWDTMPELDALAADMRASVAELRLAAGAPRIPPRRRLRHRDVPLVPAG